MSLKPTSKPSLWQFIVLLLTFASALLAGASSPVETRVQAVLVWGTDEAKPTGKNLKEVDAKLRDRLANVFKWKNYFEVNRQTATLPSMAKVQTLKLSDECFVEVKLLPENVAEVKLMGKGKAIGAALPQLRHHPASRARAFHIRPAAIGQTVPVSSAIAANCDGFPGLAPQTAAIGTADFTSIAQ